MAAAQTDATEAKAAIRSGAMWFGWAISTWEAIFFWVTVVAAVAGAASVTAAFMSAIIGFKISDVVTKASSERIASAEARAWEAKLELTKYKEPRHVSESQRTAIVDALRRFAGTTFSLCTLPGDEETATFAEEVAATLRHAKFSGEVDDSFFGVVTGVIVTVNSEGGVKPEDRAAAGAVLAALTAAGIQARAGADQAIPALPNNPRKAILIGVGKKQ